MEDSQVIEAILALASAVSGKDKTDSQAGSVDAALEVLSSVVSDSSMEGNESIYEAAQFATNRSTDTDSAAGAILALAQYASGMVKPEGTIAITENGEGIDVAQYATADVSVSGGGGGSATTDVYLWDTTTGGSNLLPTKVEYLSAYSGGDEVYTELQIEPVTETYSGMTMHGVLVKECPCGACFKLTPPSSYEVSQCKVGWSEAAFPPTGANFETVALMPLDGMVVSGFFKMNMAS